MKIINNIMAKKDPKILICMNCLEDSDPTTSCFATKTTAIGLQVQFLYCEKCVKELGLTEITSYNKPRKKRKNYESKK